MKITGAICVTLLILFSGIANAGDICLLQKTQLEEAPLVRQEDSIYYCSLVNYNSIGDGSNWEFAIRLTPDELAPFTGWSIIAISWYHYDGGSPVGVVKVYDEGTPTHPGPVITSEPYSGAGVGWVRCDLSSPVLIGGSTDLWCSVEVFHPAGYYPAGVDSGPAVDGKGDWIRVGGSWQELQNLGFDYNWNMICIVDSFDVGIEETKTPFREPTNSLNVSPNPFTTSTSISLIFPRIEQGAEGIELNIYDLNGRLVKDLSLGTGHSAIVTAVSWDGTNNRGNKVLPGLYFCRLKVGKYRAVRKIIKLH